MRPAIAKRAGDEPLLNGSDVLGSHQQRLAFLEEVTADPSIAPGLARAVGSSVLLLNAARTVIAAYSKYGDNDTAWVRTGSTAGEAWFLPTGGDDGAALTTFIASEYGAGGQRRAIRLLPLPYTIATPIVPLSYMHLSGRRGATILNSTMAVSGGPTHPNSVFRQEPTFELTGGVIAKTTLTANAVVGSRSVTVASITVPTIAVGDTILIQQDSTGNDQHAQMYVVAGITDNGGGTYTLLLDRECLYVWAAATAFVAHVTYRPTNVHISDLTITGSGDRAFELAGSLNCTCERITTNGSWASIHASFDVGGRGNIFRDCDATRTTGGLEGFALEGQEDSHLHRITVSGFSAVSNFGVALWNSLACSAETIRAYKCLVGVGLLAGPTTLVDGCVDCVVSDVKCYACPTGVYNQSKNTTLKSIRCYGSATAGINNLALSAGLTVIDYAGDGNAQDISTNRGCTITGFKSVNVVTAALSDSSNTSGEQISLTDFEISSAGDGNGIIVLGHNARVIVSRGKISLFSGVPRYGFYLGAGVNVNLWVHNAQVVVPSGVGLAVAGGGAANYFLDQVDFTAGTATFGGTKKTATYA